jgi:uncharacterized protein YjiK
MIPSALGQAHRTWAGTFVLLLSITTAVTGQDIEPLGVLSSWNVGDEDVPRWRLPSALNEVSGLTFAPDGRLYSHDDERGRVFELDPMTGEVVRWFDLGRRISGDFEGIAAVQERLFMVDSDGYLFEFRPGPPETGVGYRVIPTGIGERCEVEGLAYDEASLSVLIPCKRGRERRLVDRLTIFSFSLGVMALDETPRVSLAFEDLGSVGLDRGFHPSAVDVDPTTGAILLASAQERAILELSESGVVIAAVRVARRQMPQIEGLAVSPEGDLLLSSEASGGRPRLARFESRPQGGSL